MLQNNKMPLCVLQNRIKSAHRDRLREFMSLTQTTERVAIQCLSVHDWKLDIALDAYFTHPEYFHGGGGGQPPMVSSGRASAVDRRKLEQLYNKYKGGMTDDCLKGLVGSGGEYQSLVLFLQIPMTRARSAWMGWWSCWKIFNWMRVHGWSYFWLGDLRRQPNASFHGKSSCPAWQT